MNDRFVAIFVVGLLTVVGCASEQSSEAGSASPSLTVPSTASIPASTPTSPPSATASPGVAPIPDGPLAAGIYRIPQWDTGCGERQPGCSPSPAHDAVRVTLLVPNGWEGVIGTIWLAEKGNGAPDGAGLLVGRGAWLLTDPCTKAEHAVPPDIAVGPTVDDFANAIADHPLLDATDPVDVTLAGYSGKYVELRVPADSPSARSTVPGTRGSSPRGRATSGTSGSSTWMASAS